VNPDPSYSISHAGRGWLIGTVLWPSLLAACLASLLFFAAVDPLLLRDAGPQLFEDLSREGGYALGFFFFWFIAACASALSLYLARRPSTRATPGPPTGPSG
jgi:hypothetical protein